MAKIIWHHKSNPPTHHAFIDSPKTSPFAGYIYDYLDDETGVKQHYWEVRERDIDNKKIKLIKKSWDIGVEECMKKINEVLNELSMVKGKK